MGVFLDCCYNGEMAIIKGQKKGGEIKNWWAPVLAGAAVIIFTASGWGWWHFVRSSPERTFYAAVVNSFRTTGVTRRVDQASSGQRLEQRTAVSVGAQHVAHGHTTISQQGDITAQVKTETISTPKEDYVRYTAIETTQKNQAGKPLDFSKLVNVWGKSTAQGNSPQGAGELYNESVLGVVPVGNLSAAQRQEIMQFIRSKNVYTLDPKKIERGRDGMRPVYTYEVTVAPEAYIGMLKLFGKAAGLTQLEGIDPANYKEAQPLEFKVKVDVWSRQLSAITFGSGERTERLSGYGIPRSVALPKDTISLQELQNRLQATQ